MRYVLVGAYQAQTKPEYFRSLLKQIYIQYTYPSKTAEAVSMVVVKPFAISHDLVDSQDCDFLKSISIDCLQEIADRFVKCLIIQGARGPCVGLRSVLEERSV